MFANCKMFQCNIVYKIYVTNASLIHGIPTKYKTLVSHGGVFLYISRSPLPFTQTLLFTLPVLYRYKNDPLTCQSSSSSFGSTCVIADLRTDRRARKSYATACTITGEIGARQFPRTLVPAQSRRGDWEILRTDGSGSRLVLLLLLRPLAPSIVHVVCGKSAEKETRVMRGYAHGGESKREGRGGG